MKQHMLKLFKLTGEQSTADTPVYMLKDGKLYRTVYHQDGWSDRPDYDLGNDGKIYRTENHPHGLGEEPDYEFGKDKRLYRTDNHPEGASLKPDYELMD